MDCSLPDSSIHGIFQARVLEWVPLPSPRKRLPAPKIGALKIIGEAKGSKLGWVFRNVFRRLHQCPSRQAIVSEPTGGKKPLLFLSVHGTRDWALVCWPLEKAMAPHSSTFAWKIPWMEEPGRLQSMGLLGVRLN